MKSKSEFSGGEIPKANPSKGIYWREAFRSLRDIVANPNNTARAVDFFYAASPRGFERSFQRFVAEPTSGVGLNVRAGCLRCPSKSCCLCRCQRFVSLQTCASQMWTTSAV